MKKYDYVVYIGKFQPIHNGHMKVIDHAMKVAHKVIIILGSINQHGTEKNPLTFNERAEIINKILSKKYPKRYLISGVKDHPVEAVWNKSVEDIVERLSKHSKKIAIIGHFKDDSSYYLKNFSNWELVAVENYMNINATEIRKAIREGKQDEIKDKVPPEVIDFFTKSKI